MAIQKSKMSKRKKAVIILLILLMLPLLLLLVNSVRQTIKTSSAKQKVNVARAEVEKTTDETILSFEAALTNSGIAASKVASSKVDVCYINHKDAGWFAQNWYQDCYLRYVGGYITNLNKVDVKDIISKSTELQKKTDKLSNFDSFYPNTCVLSNEADFIQLYYLPVGATQKDDYSCMIPNQLQGVGTIDPILLDSELSARKYQIFDTNSIGRDQNQIWFEFDRNYYREDLGCNVGV